MISENIFLRYLCQSLIKPTWYYYTMYISELESDGMDIRDFYNEYDLHDSLLEKVDYNCNKLILTIDFCNWRQKYYCSTESETKLLNLVFYEVKNYSLDAINPSFDSDTILEFRVTNQEEHYGFYIISIVILGNGDIKIIKFESNNITIMAD